MVYHGPSKGCLTCQKRRKKCDGTKPTCQRCHKSKRACGGYPAQATETFLASAFSPISGSASLARKCTLPLATDAQLEQDVIPREATDAIIDEVALRSFVYEFCIPEGFLAGLEQILLRQPLDSILVRACQALSHGLTGRQKNRELVRQRGRRRYEEVVGRFAREIAGPGFVVSVEAVVTALLLGLYEVVAADCSGASSLHDHVLGIRALLQVDEESDNILDPLRPLSLKHYSNTSVDELLNISRHIENLRTRFDNLPRSSDSASKQLQSIQEETLSLQDRLQTWQASQPELYRPRSIGRIPPSSSSSDHSAPPVGLWPGSINTYFDLGVAEAWNRYRILTCSLSILLADVTNSRLDKDQLKGIEGAVNGILASIPYHLFEDPQGTVSADKPLDPGKCIGGILIMQHLYLLARLDVVSGKAKKYIQHCLEWVGSRMGIGQAELFATLHGDESTSRDLEDIRMLVKVGLLI